MMGIDVVGIQVIWYQEDKNSSGEQLLWNPWVTLLDWGSKICLHVCAAELHTAVLGSELNL